MKTARSKAISRTIPSLDTIIAILLLAIGIIACILFTVIWHYYQIATLVIVAGASLFYLLSRSKLSQAVILPYFHEAHQLRLLTHIIFVVTLSASMWLLWNNLYYRPPLYFALVVISGASIILNILYSNEERDLQKNVILFKIIILSLFVYGGTYWEFPGIFGADPWRHITMIQSIIYQGHLSYQILLQYYLLPVFHIESASLSILTSLSPYIAVFASTGLFAAITCVFVYFIGKKVATAKIGLIAALIWPLADYTLQRATGITPNTLGCCLFTVILYLVLCRNIKTLAVRFLFMLLSITLILTHSVSALIMLVCLISIFIGIKLHRRTGEYNITYGDILFFGIAMLLRWMQNPPGGSAFLSWNISSLISVYQMGENSIISSTVSGNISYWIQIVNQGTNCLLIGFGVIGGLFYLQPKNRSGLRTAILLMVALFFAVVFGSSLSNLFMNVLPYRWYMFLYIPLSVLAIQGLSILTNTIGSRIFKSSIVIFVILTMLFLSNISNITENVNPFFYNGAKRSGYTQSELSAIQTLSDMEAGSPQTDADYGDIFRHVIGEDKYDAMIIRNADVFILRNYYLQHPEWDEKWMDYISKGYLVELSDDRLVTKGRVHILDYVRENVIEDKSVIYNNGSLKAYALTESNQ